VSVNSADLPCMHIPILAAIQFRFLAPVPTAAASEPDDARVDVGLPIQLELVPTDALLQDNIVVEHKTNSTLHTCTLTRPSVTIFNISQAHGISICINRGVNFLGRWSINIPIPIMSRFICPSPTPYPNQLQLPIVHPIGLPYHGACFHLHTAVSFAICITLSDTWCCCGITSWPQSLFLIAAFRNDFCHRELR